ncbi:LOW QUALITY PROTEIN: hypothetical protein BC936DRAFT_144851 [Jimgerdemannia flammicorona]|uniref:Uncharacterized protein n=1 Tax=Jimgerdemannia flammicorona TaxID=994334 RepID=A0A433DM09_9FUNG|nr:LOW QUALITY PROTEIN: hypothetical protein BC936DRAFT_144851 [Jimgerdemannia flammicorona]
MGSAYKAKSPDEGAVLNYPFMFAVSFHNWIGTRGVYSTDMDEPDQTALVYDPAEPTEWRAQLVDLAADLNLPDQQYTQATFADFLIGILPQTSVVDDPSELDRFVAQLVEQDKDSLSPSAIVLRNSKWHVDVEGLDILAKVEKAKVSLKKRGYDLYKLEDLFMEEEKEVEVLFQDFDRRSRLYLESSILPKKYTPPDLSPPSIDQDGNPVAMPFFPVPPLDQLASKMPRVQNLAEPGPEMLPFANVECSMDMIDRVRPVLDKETEIILRTTLRRFIKKSEDVMEESVAAFLNDDEAQDKLDICTPQILEPPLFPRTPQHRPATSSMSNDLGQTPSLQGLVRALTQDSPEQAVPRSDPVLMEDEVDLVHEGRIGMARIERWDSLCKLADSDDETHEARKFVDELDKTAKARVDNEDDSNECSMGGHSDGRAGKILGRMGRFTSVSYHKELRKSVTIYVNICGDSCMFWLVELPLIPTAREWISTSISGTRPNQDGELPTSLSSFLTHFGIATSSSAKSIVSTFSPPPDPVELEKHDMERLFGSNCGAGVTGDEVVRTVVVKDRFDERKLGLSIIKMEVPDLPPPPFPVHSTIYPALHTIPALLNAKSARRSLRLLDIDVRWNPVPASIRDLAPPSVGRFVEDEDAKKVVEQMEGTHRRNEDEEEGWDAWLEWRRKWESEHEIEGTDLLPRCVEEGSWRKRMTRRKLEEAEERRRERECGPRSHEYERHDKRGRGDRANDIGCQGSGTREHEHGDKRRRADRDDGCNERDRRHHHHEPDHDGLDGNRSGYPLTRSRTANSRGSKEGGDGTSWSMGLERRVSSGVVKRMDKWLERLAEGGEEGEADGEGLEMGSGEKEAIMDADESADENETERRKKIECWARGLETKTEPEVIVINEDECVNDDVWILDSKPSSRTGSISYGARSISVYPNDVGLRDEIDDDEPSNTYNQARCSPRMGLDMLLARGRIDLEHIEKGLLIDEHDRNLQHMEGPQSEDKDEGMMGVQTVPDYEQLERSENEKQSTCYDDECDAILDAELMRISEGELVIGPSMGRHPGSTMHPAHGVPLTIASASSLPAFVRDVGVRDADAGAGAGVGVGMDDTPPVGEATAVDFADVAEGTHADDVATVPTPPADVARHARGSGDPPAASFRRATESVPTPRPASHVSPVTVTAATATAACAQDTQLVWGFLRTAVGRPIPGAQGNGQGLSIACWRTTEFDPHLHFPCNSISPASAPSTTPDPIPYCELTRPLNISAPTTAVTASSRDDSALASIAQGLSKCFREGERGKGRTGRPGRTSAAIGKSAARNVYKGDFVPASAIRRSTGDSDGR